MFITKQIIFALFYFSPDVTFCGYTIPHPSEDKINFRIQTSGPKAIDILRRGLTDLQEHCSLIMDNFSQEVAEFKHTR